MITIKPNSLITGILSVLIIGLVFSSAIIVRVYVTGATLYEQYQKDNKSKQSNTAKTPAPISRNSPENNYNSYSNSNNYSSYTTPTLTPTPTATPMLESNNSNSYSSNTLDETEKPSTTTSEFNGRIIADDIYIDPYPSAANPKPESQYLKKGEQIKIVCKINNLNYRIETRDSNLAEINGYSIEFTIANKQVQSCSNYNEKGSF